jgi:hypothetical protein
MKKTINQIVLQLMLLASLPGAGRHDSGCCLWYQPRGPDVKWDHIKSINLLIKKLSGLVYPA